MYERNNTYIVREAARIKDSSMSLQIYNNMFQNSLSSNKTNFANHQT